MSFKNKVVIVTGGSSGIGAATAIQFASEEADVVIVGRNESKLKNVASKCESKGKKPLTIVADVRNDESVKKIMNDTISKYGKLDILINNAGRARSFNILKENAMEAYDDTMNTNLRSVVHLTNLAAPHLVKTKGNIVNISSIAGIKALKDLMAYCTSKACMDHFTRSVALELAPNGVRVNAINPGPVKTDALLNFGVSKADSDKIWGGIGKSTPLGGLSQPDEIADLVLYLASNKAKSVTGSTYVIDNGQILTSMDTKEITDVLD